MPFTSIIATVFGGSSDPNKSAYDGHIISDTELCVALPSHFHGERPKVKVTNVANGKSAVGTIEDVGPWNDTPGDPYWLTNTRPQAESGHDQRGRKTNHAGIDLSPALAHAIGIDGMGKVDWEFVGGAAVPVLDVPVLSAPQATIQQLISIGSDKDKLQAVQHAAARKLLEYDGEVYPHDGCAITLSTLLQAGGFNDVPDTYQAIVLGALLKKLGWQAVPIGQQQAGDVGSTCGLRPHHGVDHIYLVLKTLNSDEMVIADNQQSQPHFRWASGKGGKSPTKFFLRVPSG